MKPITRLITLLLLYSIGITGNCARLKNDPLSTPITLGFASVKIEKLMQEMSRQTGASFTAEAEISALEVSIFIKGEPASQVLEGLGKVFDLSFKRIDAPGSKRYRLYRSPKQKQMRQRLLKLIDQKIKDRTIAALQQNQLAAQQPYPETLTRLLAQDEKERQQAKPLLDNRFYEVRWRTDARNIAIYLRGYVANQMSKQQWAKLWRGEELFADPEGKISGLKLPAETLEWIRHFNEQAREHRIFVNLLPPESYRDPLFALRFDRLEGVQATLIYGEQAIDGSLPSGRLYGSILEEKDWSGVPILEQSRNTVNQRLWKEPIFQTKITRIAGDPEPQFGSECFVSAWDFTPDLEWLAKRTPLSFIGAASKSGLFPRANGEQTLGRALLGFDYISPPDNLGSLILLRRKNELERQPAAISTDLIERYEKAASAKGGLDFEGWSQFISELSEAQTASFASRGWIRSSILTISDASWWNLPALRLWHSLNPLQRYQAQSEQGIKGAQLNSKQQKLLIQAIRKRHEAFGIRYAAGQKPLAEVTLKVKKERFDQGYAAVSNYFPLVEGTTLEQLKERMKGAAISPDTPLLRYLPEEVQINVQVEAHRWLDIDFRFDLFAPLTPSEK